MNLLKLVEYEIAGSWWAGWLPFGHNWISKYMIRKTKRKLDRYQTFIELREKRLKRDELLKAIYKP